ncbi:sulfatase-like hydrolase/transferase [Patescibacteria group bacterium]|nr:sulfatase-like hydrolase/transferase [Patescibacteria group bacterium]
MLLVSFIALCLSIYFYKRIKVSIFFKILFSLGTLVSIFFYVLYFIANYFTGNGITNAVFYYLEYGLEGVDFLEYINLISVASLFLLFGIVLAIWIILKKNHKEKHNVIFFLAVFLFLFVSLALNPVTVSLGKMVFKNKENIIMDKDSVFYEFYKHPRIRQIAKSKNLVFIYAEGLERTYFDEAIFPDLTKNLKKIESKSVSFMDLSQGPYAEHTIGGMVAGQCGFPLIIPSFSIVGANSMFGMDTYLESAICLGDLLHDEGYYLTYYGGAPLSFGGKGKFYLTHKFNDVKGRNELLEKIPNQDYRSAWGIYDDSLFDLAYNRYVELAKKQDKFAMFLLTLDTHPSLDGGYPSKSCNNIKYQDGNNLMLNVVACSDYLISNFVKKIRASKLDQETVIVIVSDTLGQKNDATELLNKGDRKLLYLINEPNSVAGTKIDNPGLNFDIASTMLPFIGYKGDIGMGRNLFEIESSTNRVQNIIDNLSEFKSNVLQFWKFPKIEKFIEINMNQKKIFIDNNEYEIPILIKLNDDLETILNFRFFTSNDLALIESITNSVEDNGFILIEECSKINYIINTGIDNDSFCLLAGKNNKYSYMNLTPRIDLSQEKKYYMHSFPSLRLSIEEIHKIINKGVNNFSTKMIAHAGGGINKSTYTNSFDALDSNMAKGFSYFEIDFVFTKDNKLVCLHDWESSFEDTFGFKTEEKLTLNEFKKLASTKAMFHNCTLLELASWMEKHPDAYLVTDIEGDNVEALKMISTIIPDYEKRVIPQIYSPANFSKIKEMGYDQVIWTLYRYGGTNKNVLDVIRRFYGSFAITMPVDRAKTDLPLKLKEREIPTYVHTINLMDEKINFTKNYHVTEIYTDFLTP